MSELERASLNYALKRVEEMADRLVATTRQAIATSDFPTPCICWGGCASPGASWTRSFLGSRRWSIWRPSTPLSFPDSLLNQLRGMGKAVLGGAGSGK